MTGQPPADPVISPVPISGTWAMLWWPVSHYRWLVVACCWGQHCYSQCDQHRRVLSQMGNSLLNHSHSWLSRLLLKHPQFLPAQHAELEWISENENITEAHSHSLTPWRTPVTAVHILLITNNQRLVSIVKTLTL